MANIKNDDDFLSIEERFQRLHDKLKSKTNNQKSKAWSLATKIAIGGINDRHGNENGGWNWHNSAFFEGEGDERIQLFDPRDTLIDIIGLRESGYTRQQIKNALEEMFETIHSNSVGGLRRKSRKTKKSKKSRKSRRRN